LAYLNFGVLVAQAAGGEEGGSFIPLPYMFAGLALLFYFMILRPESRRKNDHRKLLEGLKKNDRVLTVGGIYGVVTNVQRESDRVTIKVDESNNTKLDVTFASIAQVIAEPTSAEKTDKS
jgi:preprotein translocase subunit YajC